MHPTRPVVVGIIGDRGEVRGGVDGVGLIGRRIVFPSKGR